MNHLVVARYQEDRGWYERIPRDWKLLEVQKGRELPNTGREATSYLWAIESLYDTLADADLVAFVQGDPFQHCQDVDLFLLLDRPTDGFRALGDHTYISGGNGEPHHQGIPVADCYERWLGKPWPGFAHFAPGAQFVVTGRDIKQHTKDWYQRLSELVLAEEWGAWILERLWPTVFPPLAQKDLVATFYCQATPVTTYLRCELPARYLPGKVARECVVAHRGDEFFFPNHEGAAGVFQFAGDPWWHLVIHGLQSKGVRCLVESDDNYFTVAPSMKNTGWVKHKNQGGHSLDGHRSILKTVDACVVTTEHLARQYRKHNPNVYVAPNCIEPADWPVVPKRDDGVLRIGWFASRSHVEDARLVERAFRWASSQPGVEVVTMGLNPTWWDFPRKHIEWQDLPGYREAMVHELDVGVAPVVATPWALCRSDLKAIEKAFAGAALVLSDVAPYANWRDEETCLKARTPKDFLRQVQRLVRDRDEVKQLAAAGRGYVLRERTIEANVDCWRAALDGTDDVKQQAA